MPAGLDAGLARFVERFALELTASGLPRMPSRVFAGLMVSETGELTAAEIAERLQVSPASVSNAVRYLEQLDMVERDREPGSRRDHYRVDHEVWQEVFSQRDVMLDGWIARMAEGVELVGADSPAGQRLAEAQEFFTFLRDEVADLLKRWEQHRDAWRAARSG